ncbi:MAG: hypothetical protein ACUVRT_11315 [Armatimonadota bacterium]
MRNICNSTGVFGAKPVNVVITVGRASSGTSGTPLLFVSVMARSFAQTQQRLLAAEVRRCLIQFSTSAYPFLQGGEKCPQSAEADSGLEVWG